jgi:hypothetical protein
MYKVSNLQSGGCWDRSALSVSLRSCVVLQDDIIIIVIVIVIIKTL